MGVCMCKFYKCQALSRKKEAHTPSKELSRSRFSNDLANFRPSKDRTLDFWYTRLNHKIYVYLEYEPRKSLRIFFYFYFK